MRNYFALAFAIAAVTAPLHGQRAEPAHHGDGYDITFPGRCTPAQTKSGMTQGFRTEVAMFECNNVVVVIGRYGSDAIEDTTVATRRAMLRLARVGMLNASGANVRVLDEREFERDDRVGTRMSVSVAPDGADDTTVYGTAEVSVARQGGLTLWMVVYLAPKQNAATGPNAERLLDSFHLTDAAPAQGEARGFRILDENPKVGKAEKTER